MSRGERRTRWVVAITLAMMALEVWAGLAFGSMALLADGWHMGTHAAALLVAAFAYVHARRHARSGRYTFGTGKVGALGGFASAVGLATVAVYVTAASLGRLSSRTAIQFDEAIAVAVIGLLVNIVCAVLLHEGTSLTIILTSTNTLATSTILTAITITTLITITGTNMVTSTSTSAARPRTSRRTP
jgi:cation diffusion facilitator family transporter